MNATARLLVCSVAALGFLASAGCGGPKVQLPKTYPVSVKISRGGKPVEGASVTFIPQDKSGRGASGVTDASGVAKMAVPGLVDGAMAGKYWVTVSKVEGTQSDSATSAEEFYKQQKSEAGATPSSPRHALPVKYLSAQSSGLECTVKEQKEPQLFEFNLTD